MSDIVLIIFLGIYDRFWRIYSFSLLKKVLNKL